MHGHGELHALRTDLRLRRKSNHGALYGLIQSCAVSVCRVVRFVGSTACTLSHDRCILYYSDVVRYTTLHTHTHTHTFFGPLSGTTQVSRYQKGKTNLDFTEERDIDWQWHQLGRMQVCTSTPPLSFLQAGCPFCRPTNSVKALKAEALKAVIRH